MHVHVHVHVHVRDCRNQTHSMDYGNTAEMLSIFTKSLGFLTKGEVC